VPQLTGRVPPQRFKNVSVTFGRQYVNTPNTERCWHGLPQAGVKVLHSVSGQASIFSILLHASRTKTVVYSPTLVRAADRFDGHAATKCALSFIRTRRCFTNNTTDMAAVSCKPVFLYFVHRVIVITSYRMLNTTYGSGKCWEPACVCVCVATACACFITVFIDFRLVWVVPGSSHGPRTHYPGISFAWFFPVSPGRCPDRPPSFTFPSYSN
jgi:hypothetical protein